MTSKALSALAAHVNKQGNSEHLSIGYSLKQGRRQQQQQQQPQQQPHKKTSQTASGQPLLSIRIPYPGTNTGVNVLGGWLQLNSTVVPYVVRHKLRQTRASTPTVVQQRWLPLSVLRNAANLLTDVEVSPMRASAEESAFLNQCCRHAGVAFTFVKHTKLVTLEAVLALHEGAGVFVYELTAEDLAQIQSLNVQEGDKVVAQTPKDGSDLLGKAAAADAATETTLSSKTAALEHHQQLLGAPTADEKGIWQRVEAGNEAAQPPGPSLKSSVLIQPAKLCGKLISCLLRADGKRYALLDALCKIFFSESDVESLQLAIEKEAKLPTEVLTMVEERAFLAFYKLPWKALRSRVLIDIELIARHLNALRMVLQGVPYQRRLGVAASSGSKTPHAKDANRSKGTLNRTGTHPTGSRNRLLLPLTAAHPERSEPGRVESTSGQNKALKCKNEGVQGGGFKIKRRRLEDAISKLKHVSS